MKIKEETDDLNANGLSAGTPITTKQWHVLSWNDQFLDVIY